MGLWSSISAPHDQILCFLLHYIKVSCFEAKTDHLIRVQFNSRTEKPNLKRFSGDSFNFVESVTEEKCSFYGTSISQSFQNDVQKHNILE